MFVRFGTHSVKSEKHPTSPINNNPLILFTELDVELKTTMAPVGT